MNQYADEKQKNLYKKFPSTHYLSNPTNVHNILLWNTFFRRNLHRLALDYLKIGLHWYQVLILYFMGISNLVVIVASRACAKSFIIALYACCRCIVRPQTKVVLSSATKGQSKLIVSEKIKNELMNMSPQLKKEIASIKDNQNEVIVYFHNGSTITVVPASENGRGFRSHCCVREEFRMIDKNVDDSILSPFQTIRQAPYMLIEPYASMRDLQEDPVDVYISSSWIEPHWMWGVVDQAYNGMLNDDNNCLLAFDEAITLKHNIRTMKQMEQERRKQDSLTWRLEFLNERVKENAFAFFTYTMMNKNQRCKQPFYPRTHEDVRNNKKNKYAIHKQDGEVRLVGVDMAFIENKKNDNSIFNCMRLIPDVTVYNKADNDDVEVVHGYRRIVPFITSKQGGDTTIQALEIRRLYEDFEADYIVLDTRNGGIAILDMLGKVMYDEERNVEYSPLKCMNNESFAERCTSPNAKAVIFAINASQQLNSDIAFDFKDTLEKGMIDFLVPYNTAVEDVFPNNKDYISGNGGQKATFELPFLETQLLISETTALVYEKMQQTGVIRIHEQGNNPKDRYTSVSYASYFATLLERDLYKGGKKKPNVKSYANLARKPIIKGR